MEKGKVEKEGKGKKKESGRKGDTGKERGRRRIKKRGKNSFRECGGDKRERQRVLGKN